MQTLYMTKHTSVLMLCMDNFAADVEGKGAGGAVPGPSAAASSGTGARRVGARSMERSPSCQV